jgi:hypothetical protein
MKIEEAIYRVKDKAANGNPSKSKIVPIWIIQIK